MAAYGCGVVVESYPGGLARRDAPFILESPARQDLGRQMINRNSSLAGF